MPDVSLPPVGELVQITHVDGRSLLAYREHEADKRWLRLVTPFAAQALNVADVQSWCRVLVLPDTEDICERIAAAIYDTDWGPGGPYESARAEQGWAKASDEGKPIYRAESAAVLAAARGAAIR